MYYYILESPSNRAIRQTYQKLRDLLTNLSIVGEIVSASPARTPAELAEMGLAKGYSTIVAVGGDAHINEVATAVVGQAVLGIIPIEAGPQVAEIIGTSDIRDAAESLRRRKISLQSTVLIEPDTLVFLDAEIRTPKLAKASLVIDNRVRAHAYFNSLVINRSLEIKLRSIHLTEARKILGIFNTGGKEVVSESLFHAKSLRLITDPILRLSVAGQAIAETPTQLRLIPESLKVIAKRGTFLE